MIVNKLWREELDKDELWIVTTIQSFIDLYCFETEKFKVVEDITPENCADFWKIILNQFKHYNITLDNLSDLGDALQFYFTSAYELEYAEYPVYPKNDRRNLAMYIDRYLQVSNTIIVLPEDVPKLIEYLDTPSGNEREAGEVMDKYLNQFTRARREEEGKRAVAIKKTALFGRF